MKATGRNRKSSCALISFMDDNLLKGERLWMKYICVMIGDSGLHGFLEFTLRAGQKQISCGDYSLKLLVWDLSVENKW